MRYLIAIACLFIVVLGTGCKTIEVVEKRVYVPFTMDDSLLTIYKQPLPPKKEEFLAMSCENQRRSLARHSIELSATLEKANITLNEIGVLYKKHHQDVDVMNKNSGASK